MNSREKVQFEKIFLELKVEDFDKSKVSSLANDVATIELIESPSYLLYRSWHDLVGKPYGWHERPRINDRLSIETLLSSTKVKMYLLKDKDEVVGYALTENDNPGEVEISDFGFSPNKTGQGYGSVFFPKLLEMIFDTDINRVWLSTRSTNDPRVPNFYKKFGFDVYQTEQVEEESA